MRFTILNWINSLIRLLYTEFKQSLSDVRARHLPYMLIFSLAPLFINVQDRVLGSSYRLLRLDAMSWMGACYCIGAGMLFAFTSRRRMPLYARGYAVAAFILFFLWLGWKDPHASYYFAFAFAFFFGGCAAIATYFFIYALNRSERFLGASITILLAVLFQFLYSVRGILQSFSYLYMLILVFVTLICTFFYRSEDARVKIVSGSPSSDRRMQVGLLLYFFFAHKTIEIFYTYTREAASPSAMRFNGAIGMLVLILSLFLYFRSKYSIWHMCYLFFLFMLLANVFALPDTPAAVQVMSWFFHAFESIGFIASYALLGEIMSRQADFKFFKRVLIIALNASFLIYMIPGFLTSYYPDARFYLSTGVSLLLFLIFLMMAPHYARLLTPKKGPWSWSSISAGDTAGPTEAALPLGAQLSGEPPEQAVPVGEGGVWHPGSAAASGVWPAYGSPAESTADRDPAESPADSGHAENNAGTGRGDSAPRAGQPAVFREVLQEQYQMFIAEKGLTKRETQVIYYILQGFLYKQCASEMNISVETVKFHAGNAYRKLGVTGRSGLFSLFFKE